MIKDFLIYQLNAKDEHSIHSPFVFDFYTTIIKKRELKFETEDIELLFSKLKSDSRVIAINDLGAGSKYGNKPTKKVSQIAKASLKNKKWADIVAAIVAKYEYCLLMELGTSFGLTAAKMARASPFGKVYTFEGCGETLKVAKANFSQLGIHNIIPMLGDIDFTLDNILSQFDRLDLVFFDANHQYEATMRYFKKCLTKSHENSCFIFDDIYWSEGMKKAWNEIIESPEVTISMDFFQLGIVFFSPKQTKQHFVLKT